MRRIRPFAAAGLALATVAGAAGVAAAATGSGTGPTGYGNPQFMVINWGGTHEGTEHVRSEAYKWPGDLRPYQLGKAYLKVTVTRKPSTKDTPVQFCVWRKNGTQWVGPGTDEACAKMRSVTRTGTFYLDLGSPKKWWARSGAGNFDWSKPFTVAGFEVKNGAKPAEVMMYKRCGSYCYSGTDLFSHIPIDFRAEVWFVKPGVTFKPPSTWSGSPWS